jgi:hypothetical protein
MGLMGPAKFSPMLNIASLYKCPPVQTDYEAETFLSVKFIIQLVKKFLTFYGT